MKWAFHVLMSAPAAFAHRPPQKENSFLSVLAMVGPGKAHERDNETSSLMGDTEKAHERASETSSRYVGSTSLYTLITTYGVAMGQCTLPTGIQRQTNPSLTPEKMLENGKPFTYMRWGDGEWMQAGRPEYKNVLKSYREVAAGNYFPMLGSFFFCKETNPGRFDDMDSVLKTIDEPVPFYEKFYMDPLRIVHEAWSRASIHEGGQSWALADSGPVVTCQDIATHAPQKTSIVLVGPSHLNKLTELFRHKQWIDAGNADGRVQEIAEKMIAASRDNEPLLFLVAAGWAKLLITDIVYKQIGSKDTIIDIGSSVDPYANVMSRDYSPEARKSICQDTPCFTVPGTCA